MAEDQRAADSKVFISYSRKDKEFVGKLNEGLDSNGIQAWVDWEGIPPSADWMQEITRAIQGGDAFLFVISPDSLASKVCLEELELGLQNNKKLIPILYRDPEKGTAMPDKLAATNWIYIRDQNDFEAALKDVIKSIHTDLGWVQQHTRLLQRAVEWEAKNRDGSFLLQGADLEEAERWMTEATTSSNREVLPLQMEYIREGRKASSRRQRNLLIGVSIALVVSILLGIYAFIQRGVAVENETLAKNNEMLANNNAATAIANENARATQQSIAESNEALARSNEQLAQAQRSAAQAQIYQNELDTSTLLAIDSWQRSQSLQAEDTLRNNLSFLPIPIKQMSQEGKIWNSRRSPDGTRFLTSSDKSACLWSMETGEKYFCVEHEGIVYDALFSMDASTIFTAGEDGHLSLWDATDGKLQQQFDLGSTIWDIEVSSDGRWLAAGTEGGTAAMYDLSRLDKKPLTLSLDTAIYKIKFDRTNLWIGIGTASGKIVIWRAESKFTITAPVHRNEIYALEFSPDSKWIASASADSTAALTRASDGAPKYYLPHTDWVEDVDFSPDGTWFVTASDDNRVYVWDTATGKEKLRMRHTDFVQEVKVSPDGQWIASASVDRSVRIWSVVSGSRILQIPLDSAATTLLFSKDGKRLVTGSANGKIDIWDISFLATHLGYIEFPEYVHRALFSPDGNWLAVNTDDKLVRLIPRADLLQTPDGKSGTVIIKAETLTYALEFSPDSSRLVIAEKNHNQALLHDIQKKSTLVLPHGAEVSDVAFSLDSQTAITSGTDKRVVFWDAATGEQRAEIQNAGEVFSLEISPDGKFLAAGSQDTTTVWDLAAKRQVADLPQIGKIQALAFSRDGNWLATASSEGTIMFWKAGQGYAQLPKSMLVSGQARLLSFDPDHRWMAVAGSAGFVYLWDVDAAQEVARLPHGDAVTSVSFSPDGKYLATVSRKVVDIWDTASIPVVTTDNLDSAACGRLTSNLTTDEWNILFAGEEYRLLCPDLSTGP